MEIDRDHNRYVKAMRWINLVT